MFEGTGEIYPERSSSVERRGVALVCGAIPSRLECATPSEGTTAFNGPLIREYSTGADCRQGHHANARRNQSFIACVIIVSLPSIYR